VSGEAASRVTRRLERVAFALASFTLTTLVAGCGLNGDFNRMRSSLVRDDTHAWLGPAATRPSNSTWKHQLTDEERRLRDLAYPLIEPPHERHQWHSVLGEHGLKSRPWPYPDRGAYASRLFQTAYRSQTARYNKLIEDVRNDLMRIDPFFMAARYVADMDRKREQSMRHVSHLTEEERANTVQRMEENRAIVLWVQEALHERAASYRIALERLVIAAPAPVAVEAERTIILLEQRADGFNA
jgi:nitrate reductase assembly molybdenum cofactor insertion protein NarJ